MRWNVWIRRTSIFALPWLIACSSIGPGTVPRDRFDYSSAVWRQFQAHAPDCKWVGDFTHLWTTEGWLFVAAVLDLYSRHVVD